MTSACTIIARNYLGNARVLAESFFTHHPDGAFTILIVDDEDREVACDDARVDWRRLADIGLDTPEIHRLAGIYDVTELSTAVKPVLLRRLLDEGCGEVIYLDPDIYLYDSLADVVALAAQHGIVLTPHTTAPFPDDENQIDALQVLAAGIYNLGFIAVGSSARPFLDWWWQQTRRQALMDVARMRFTDQRWVDYVPSLFPHHILKDPGYNVAYWNLHARTIAIVDGRYRVEGVPLRFFHFSGFDPAKPWLLSKHQGDRPRILLSEHPIVARICQEYVTRLAQAGTDTPSRHAYGWKQMAAGYEWTSRMRRVYWRGVLDAERGKAPEPPDPFDRADPDRFVAWLNAPGESGPAGCSRFLYAIYCGRPDLQAHFHHVGDVDAERFADWLWLAGAAEESIPIALLPAREGDRAMPATPATAPATLAPGLNIVGYFRSEMGVGEAARLAIRAVEAAGIPYATQTRRTPASRQEHAFEERATDATPFDINLLCVNADAMTNFAREIGPRFFTNRHTIGYWFWEVDPLPPSMHRAFEHVDEVWAATDYVADILRKAGRKPVFTVPLPLPVPAVPPGITREQLGLPDRFTFLFVFDFLGIAERKNPLGLIEAFTRAFGVDEGPVLVLKSINGHLRVSQLEQMRAAIAGRPDILSMDGFSSADEKTALLAACDCYVSLHRAEGLGLTIAEAMALGKPAIATAYSGNLHFMTDENSYRVDYTLSTVPADCDPYPVGARWADPDLGHAARLMREVYERPLDAARKAERGRTDILERHGAGPAAAAIAQRLDAIREARARIAVEVEVAVASVDAPETPDAADAVEAGVLDAVEPVDATVPDAVEAHVSAAPDVHEETLAPPQTPAIAALQALAPQLEMLARPRLSVEGRRWPAARRALQRAFFRLIQPYSFQQRQFNEALVQALLESVKRLSADVHARQTTERASQQQGLAQLAQLAASTGASAAAATAALADAVTRGQSATQTSLASLEASLADLQERLRVVLLTQEGQRLAQHTIDGGSRIAYGQTNGVNGHENGHSIVPPDEPLFQTRKRLYLPLLAHRTPVFELGCGYGRMLDLLRVAKLPAFGIESNPHMVWHCRANGHLVEETDALDFLRANSGAGETVGAIFSARLHDHPAVDRLQELIWLCRRRLASHGVLIAEMSMPGEGDALRPESVLALCRRAGFEAAQVLFHANASPAPHEGELRGRYAVVATAGSR